MCIEPEGAGAVPVATIIDDANRGTEFREARCDGHHRWMPTGPPKTRDQEDERFRLAFIEIRDKTRPVLGLGRYGLSGRNRGFFFHGA